MDPHHFARSLMRICILLHSNVVAIRSLQLQKVLASKQKSDLSLLAIHTYYLPANIATFRFLSFRVFSDCLRSPPISTLSTMALLCVLVSLVVKLVSSFWSCWELLCSWWLEHLETWIVRVDPGFHVPND